MVSSSKYIHDCVYFPNPGEQGAVRHQQTDEPQGFACRNLQHSPRAVLAQLSPHHGAVPGAMDLEELEDKIRHAQWHMPMFESQSNCAKRIHDILLEMQRTDLSFRNTANSCKQSRRRSALELTDGKFRPRESHLGKG